MERHLGQVEQLSEILVEGATDLGLLLTEDQVSQFIVYFEELIAWNRKTNLTAITDEREVAVKHFLDSLACKLVLPERPTATMLDIGTGAGFPGLPLKIVTPCLELALLEPSQKKIAFLRHLVGVLRLKGVTTLPERLEQLAAEPEWHSRFSLIITRALRIDQALPAIRQLLQHDGCLILCRSTPWNQSGKLSQFSLVEERAYTLPDRHGRRVLTVLKPLTH